MNGVDCHRGLGQRDVSIVEMKLSGVYAEADWQFTRQMLAKLAD